MKRKGMEIETVVVIIVALVIGMSIMGIIFGWWDATGEFILNMLTE